jgi:DNA-directed RNA polymerase specialized sigma24 family protein
MEGTMHPHLDPLSDWDLIQLCLAGNDSAFKVLVTRHQPSLMFSIRTLLRRERFDTHLVEDMAQSVWLALIDKRYDRLARYQALRGASLNTYLHTIAEQLLHLRHRSEGDRQAREVPLEGYDRLDPAADNGLVQAEFDEYKDSLTPKERWYVKEQLMNNPDDQPKKSSPSSANARQLKHRAQKKWDDHIGNG